MTINYTSILTREDWANLHGNDLFVHMLRNKVRVQIEKDTKVKGTDVSFKISDKDSLLDTVLDYLKEVPEDLVYYDIEDVFGHKTIYVYFASPMDKENFYHYYNIVNGLDKTTK